MARRRRRRARRSPPRRRARSVRPVARRKRRSSRRSGMGLNKLMKPIMGAAGAVLYESFISPKIPVTGTTKNLVEGGIGLALATMRGVPSPLKATGNTLLVINSVELMRSLLAGTLTTTTTTSTTNTVF